MKITVVTGPPAGGKSSYIQATKKPNDIVVDFDLLATALGSTKPHDAPEGIRSAAWAARGAAVSRITTGVAADAWIIATQLTPTEVASWIKKGATFVVVDPGEAETLARARKERTADRLDIIDAWYADPPTFPTNATVTHVQPDSGRAAQAMKQWATKNGNS